MALKDDHERLYNAVGYGVINLVESEISKVADTVHPTSALITAGLAVEAVAEAIRFTLEKHSKS